MGHLAASFVLGAAVFTSFVHPEAAGKPVCLAARLDPLMATISLLQRQYLRLDRQDIEWTKVADRLRLLVEKDQKYRAFLVDITRLCDDTVPRDIKTVERSAIDSDRFNAQQLMRLIEKRGWPVISKYGEQADQNAFLIAQHADFDPDFQARVLDLLTMLVARKETAGENFALLTDRVAEANGRKQRYGTQGDCQAGEWKAEPIEDEQTLDVRRAKVGLPPMRDYRAKATHILC